MRHFYSGVPVTIAKRAHTPSFQDLNCLQASFTPADGSLSEPRKQARHRSTGEEPGPLEAYTCAQTGTNLPTRVTQNAVF